MPTWATMTQWRPIDDVVRDLDEVIDLRPLADHRVAARAAVDRGVGADLDVVLDDDAADLRHLQVALRAHGEAEAVLADAHAGMEDDAVADEGVRDGRRSAPIEQSRPIRTCGPITAWAPITVPAPISACGPMTAPGIDRHAVLEAGRRMDEGARRDAGRAEGRRRPHGRWEQSAPAPAAKAR